MIFTSLRELPDGVRSNLPRRAQEIYIATFNSAWSEYRHDEERAHKVAWSAVKKQYAKDKTSGKWKKKN